MKSSVKMVCWLGGRRLGTSASKSRAEAKATPKLSFRDFAQVGHTPFHILDLSLYIHIDIY
jgi:hypothetical protein